jgi:hypothetical protein
MKQKSTWGGKTEGRGFHSRGSKKIPGQINRRPHETRERHQSSFEYALSFYDRIVKRKKSATKRKIAHFGIRGMTIFEI